MNLPPPKPGYDLQNEAATRQELEKADRQNLKAGQDIEMRAGSKLVLSSPDGTRYYLTVNNAGVLGTTAA